MSFPVFSKGGGGETPESLRDKLVSLPEEERLPVEAVKGAAQVVNDPTTGQTVIVGPDGVPISLGGLDSIAALDLIDQQPVSAPVMVEFPSPYREGGDAYLDGLSQVQRQALVHPSVIHIPGGFAGFEFWAAITPYPGSNDKYENPCVYCSRDGINWQVPVGVTNPLVGPPAGGFLSDVYLTNHRGELYLFYRSVKTITGVTTRELLLMTSRDGSTWSAPVVVHTADSADAMSPSFLWNEATQKWTLYYHYSVTGGNALRSVESNSDNIYGGFNSATITDLQVETTTTALWWHSEFRRVGTEVYAVLTEGSLYSSPGMTTRLAVSTDGIKFAIKRLRNWYGSYKSSLVPVGEGLRVIHGLSNSVDPTLPGYYTMSQQLGAGAVNALLGAVTPAQQVLLDTFNRPDSPTPGTPDRGAAWQVQTGAMAITSGLLTQVNSGNTRLFNSLGTASYDVRMKISTLGSELWLIAGFVDLQNYLRLGKGGSGVLALQVFTSNVMYNLALAPYAPASGDELRVVKTGPRMRFYLNGEVVYEKGFKHLTLGYTVGVGCAGASYSSVESISAINLR
ncbi:hypothetical protein [Methylobacillus sp.]|uniref:hypothetical protein n=1 Tax=Methylobacillus sp. TaxID=56818 RepID=UPI002FE3D405